MPTLLYWLQPELFLSFYIAAEKSVDCLFVCERGVIGLPPMNNFGCSSIDKTLPISLLFAPLCCPRVRMALGCELYWIGPYFCLITLAYEFRDARGTLVDTHSGSSGRDFSCSVLSCCIYLIFYWSAQSSSFRWALKSKESTKEACMFLTRLKLYAALNSNSNGPFRFDLFVVLCIINKRIYEFTTI